MDDIDDPGYFSEEEGPDTPAEEAAPTFIEGMARSLADEEGKPTMGGALLRMVKQRVEASRAADAAVAQEDEEGEDIGRAARVLGAHRQRLDERRAELRGSVAARRPGHVQTMEREVLDIPLARIDCAGPISNIRSSMDEENLCALGSSMERRGLIHPITVVEDRLREGRFHVVAGFRRFAAAGRLGWPSIKCMIYPADTPAAVLRRVTAAENAARDELHPLDLAEAAIFARDQDGTPLEEYAEEVGISLAKLKWTVEALETLPTEIVEDWRASTTDGRGPTLNRALFYRLKNVSRDVASQIWAQKKISHERMLSAVAMGERPLRQRGQATDRRPGPRQLSYLSSVIRRGSRDQFSRDEVCSIVDYVNGIVRQLQISGLSLPAQRPFVSRRRRDDELELPQRGLALGGEP